jgi:serine/threonine protein kinase
MRADPTRIHLIMNLICCRITTTDDDSVYLVEEWCRGGELHHRINDRHYSERTVASFMRAVLRTLAQCHSHHILHRDVKVRPALDLIWWACGFMICHLSGSTGTWVQQQPQHTNISRRPPLSPHQPAARQLHAAR